MVLENRNFMQPMGRLSMHSKCLDFYFFFLLSFDGGGGGVWFRVGGWAGGEDFFLIFLCSQNVPFKFPMGSIRFPICSLGS